MINPFKKSRLFFLSAILGGVVLSAQHFVINRFGQIPQGSHMEQIQKSPNYRNGEFQNLEPTSLFPANESQWSSTKEFLFGDKANRRPDRPLPVVKTDLKNLNKSDDLVVWLGHSSFYMQLAGKKILVDPVLSSYAAPLPFMNCAFDGGYSYTPETIPDIDILVISHDHWDHLDYPTIMALKDRVTTIITPLGVGSHLRYWGVPADKIHELDWNEDISPANGFAISVLPARHFSGRGMFVKNQTLWASFAFVTPEHKIYYSGDSGYGTHFADIGKRFGAFDLAILENGQYDKRWANIHMMPEEVARAADDLHARALLPVHAGRFSISLHSWDDPYKRLSIASQNKSYKLLTPMIGETVMTGDLQQTFFAWWAKNLTTVHNQP